MRKLKILLSYLLSYIAFVSIALVILLFFYGKTYLEVNEKLDYLRIEGKYTTGNIINLRQNKEEGNFIYSYEYYVDGRRYVYENRSVNSLWINENEKYLVVFSKSNPNLSVCLLHKPITNLQNENRYPKLERKDMALIVILLGEYYALYIIMFFVISFLINIIKVFLYTLLADSIKK